MSAIGRMRSAGRHRTPPGLYAAQTFDSGTVGANVTLSGGNLTALLTVGGTTSGARGTTAVTGKQYFEVTTTLGGSNTATNDGFLAVGIAQLSSSYVNLGNTVPNGALFFRSGIYVNSGTAKPSTDTFKSYFDIPVCVAVDYAAKLIWFRDGVSANWNQNSLGNPATGVGGFDITAIAGAALHPTVTIHTLNVQCVVNFGASAFLGAVPSGFN